MSAASVGHIVLASADSEAFGSLRRRPSSREERYAIGRGLRKSVPRKSLAAWSPPLDRPDPIDLIRLSHEGRLEWLIPIRVARMVISPYGFLRGTAIVMAEDVARLPARTIVFTPGPRRSAALQRAGSPQPRCSRLSHATP